MRADSRCPVGHDPLSDSAKSELRRRYRRLRQRELPAVGPSIQAQALLRVPPLLTRSGWLGLYWPLPGEADLRPLEPRLRGRVALPAVEPERGLLYRPWDPRRPLLPDRCGLPAPGPEVPTLRAEQL